VDFILDFKNGEEFAIIDQDAACTVIGAVKSNRSSIHIDVITIIDNDNAFIKQGTSIVRIGERLKK
jgi:hypothetical protein